MKKTMGLVFVLAVGLGAAQAAEVIVEGKVGYFGPINSDFRSLYGGGAVFGAEARIGVWERFMLWAEGKYFKKTGKLSFTQEDTTLKLTSGAAGLLYDYPVAAGIKLYVGAGLDYVSFNENNVIGSVSKTGFGFAAKAGVCVNVLRHLVLDGYYEYSSVKMTPADFGINVGGHEVGLGVGVRF